MLFINNPEKVIKKILVKRKKEYAEPLNISVI